MSIPFTVKMKGPPRVKEVEYYFFDNTGKKVYNSLKAKALFQCKAQLRLTKFTRDEITETTKVLLSEEERDDKKMDCVEYWISDTITVSI